jgi:DNA-binding transcriptional ArsR family regulator
VQGGRATVRAVLYMAALVATKRNPVIRRSATAPCGGETQETRTRRLHAETLNHPQHDRENASPMVCIARRTRAHPAFLGLDAVAVRYYLPFVVTYLLDPWTALGDPTRRAIFERIADRPRAVVDIARELPVSRPAVSQHLRVLKDAGLVMDHPIGSRRVYSLNPAGLNALRADLERFWSGALASYKWIVEHTDEEEA